MEGTTLNLASECSAPPPAALLAPIDRALSAVELTGDMRTFRLDDAASPQPSNGTPTNVATSSPLTNNCPRIRVARHAEEASFRGRLLGFASTNSTDQLVSMLSREASLADYPDESGGMFGVAVNSSTMPYSTGGSTTQSTTYHPQDIANAERK